MQFTKPMIELTYEIRRYCPSDLKPAIKLANPELFQELQQHYQQGASVVCKALIKELFELAGDPWPNRLQGQQQAVPKQSIRVYRGQVRAEDQATKAQQTEQKQLARNLNYKAQHLPGTQQIRLLLPMLLRQLPIPHILPIGDS